MRRTARTSIFTKPKISIRSLLALSVASALLTGHPLAARAAASPEPAATANYADARFDALASQYFALSWQLDPVRATLAGLHAGDDRLGDYSEAGFAKRSALTNRAFRELSAIDFDDLSADHENDAEILRAHLELELMALDERKTFRHDPTMYLKLAATAAQSLLERDYAPADARVHALIARERAIPAMLEDAVREIDDVDPETTELTREMIGGTVAYFRGPVAAAAIGVGDATLGNDLLESNAAVLKALQSFSIALEAGPFAHPAGSGAIGAERFNRMLQISELEPALTSAELERTAVGSLERTRSQFVATAARINPKATPQAVAGALAADHPALDRVIQKATDDLASLRRFVEDHHLLTLPPADDVRVVESPAYARSTSIASLSAAGPLEKNASVAYYNLTLPAADASPAERDAELTLFNDYAFPLVSAHEVMPGHYVNAEIDRREHLSEVRRLLPSRTFVEGWAHYVEQMIVEEGWSNRDPRVRLAELQLELQRECRAIVALRLHSENMTIADATRFFVDNAYLPEDAARKEALRAEHDPMDGAYFLGKLEILKLRDDYRNKVGVAHFTLQDFHDALLAHGDPPIAVARKLLLGSDDDGRLLY